jgi:glucose-1-phosphate adenylyltransferase
VYQNMAALKGNKLEAVLILSGDHVYHMDYRALLRYHTETDADVTIATVEHPLKDAVQFGVVEVDARRKIIGFQEKPPVPPTSLKALRLGTDASCWPISSN